MVALVALSAFSYRFMKQGFFPDMVYDQLYMEYKLPEGTNYTRVTRDLEEIEAYLKTRPEVTHVTASVGGTPGRYNLVRNIANPSLAYGELIIDFTSPDALVDNMPDHQNFPLPGASSLLRVKCTFSYWGQTWQSFAAYVLEASYQLGYAA